MGTVLRQLLCGFLATSSFISLRSPSVPLYPSPAAGKAVASVEKTQTDEVMRLVNEKRAVLGLQPLHRAGALDVAAEARAQDMARRDYFAHISPDGITPGDQILATGYPALLCGENIASGYSTPREVVGAWMASPSHRANILEPRYRDIGLAYTEAPGTESGVLWVQEFGEPVRYPQAARSAHVPERRSVDRARPRPTRIAAATAHGS